QRLDALKQAWADATVAGDVTRLAGLFSDKLDVSVTNLSSISMLVEIRDRRILLTGDARGDDVVDGWKAAGRDPNKPFPINILKMPHHGSDRNLTEGFLKLFPADHYVISADGKYGNPNLKTLTEMAETLGNRMYTVHFTNRTPTMKKALDALEKERQKPGRRFKIRFRDEDSSFLDIKLEEDSRRMAERMTSAVTLDEKERLRLAQGRKVEITIEQLAREPTDPSGPIWPGDRLLPGAHYRVRVHIGARSPASMIVTDRPSVDSLLPKSEDAL